MRELAAVAARIGACAARPMSRDRLLYLANGMVDQLIGLEEADDGEWTAWFNTVLLATDDEREHIIRG